MPTDNRRQALVHSGNYRFVVRGAVVGLVSAMLFVLMTQMVRAENVTPVKPSETVYIAPPTPRARTLRASTGDVCFAQIGSGATYSSTDSTAVQTAVDAAVMNDLVKVAGNCSGTQIRIDNSQIYTQVVFISNSLTLQGGYVPWDWTLPNPILNPTVLDALSGGRVVYIQTGHNVTVSGVTVNGGAVPLSNCAPDCVGAGVFIPINSNVVLDNIIASNNAAGFGGGVGNMGFVSVANSMFTGNSALQVGGGLYNFETMLVSTSVLTANTAGAGGAGLGNQGVLTVTDTAISDNTAFKVDEFSKLKGSGGGFQNTIDGSSATIINSTIAANHANGVDDDGGGGIMDFVGVVNLLNTTVSGNTTASDVTGYNTGRGAGGISKWTSVTTVTLQNSIIAGNYSVMSRPDLAGFYISNGYNIVGSTTGSSGISNGSNGDKAGNNTALLDAVLGHLGVDPVSLNSLPPLPGSPAIGNINSANCNGAPLKDQHGIDRIPPVCDSGSYQTRGFDIDVTYGGDQSTYVNSNFAIPLSVTVSSYYDEQFIGGHISFVSPSTGAGTNPVTTIGVVDSTGTATATVRANNVVGSYIIAGMATGLTSQAAYNMTNAPLPIDLRISMSVTPTFALPGQSITYTIAFSNAGSGTATGTRITDTIPAELTNLAYTNTGTLFVNQGATPYVWSVGNLTSGAGGIVTVTGIVSPNLRAVATITNTALIAATESQTTTGYNASSTYIAMWYTLQALTTGTGHGSVSAAPIGPSYPFGTDITVYQTADLGSHFNGWSPNCTQVNNQCSITLVANTDVLANFAIDKHFINISKIGNGSGLAVIDPNQQNYDYGSVVTITAISSLGSVFKGWSGDVITTTNTYSFTVFTDMNITAFFDTRRTFMPIVIRP